MDKRFFRRVRWELIKRGYIKDAFKLRSTGYSISKPKNGFYELGLSPRLEHNPLKVPIDDPNIGYDVVTAMFKRQRYEKLNKSKYLVTRCQIECEYLKLELEIAYIGEKDKQIESIYGAIKYALEFSDDLDEELQHIFFNILDHNNIYHLSLIQYKKEFASQDEFLKFVHKGYHLINLEYNKKTYQSVKDDKIEELTNLKNYHLDKIKKIDQQIKQLE